MKKYYILLIITNLLLTTEITAQIIWNGPTTIFTKANGADWTLANNQDRITNNVWITRQNNMGIFNIATESFYSSFSSPDDTEWAFGTTADINLTYTSWEGSFGGAVGGGPTTLIGQDMVLHLISDDIYIDIKFISWSGSASGGGFSYQRSTDPALGINESELVKNIKLIPNPASDIVRFIGLKETVNYRLYNILGSNIMKGTIGLNDKISLRNLVNGVYFIQLDNGVTRKIIKK